MWKIVTAAMVTAALAAGCSAGPAPEPEHQHAEDEYLTRADIDAVIANATGLPGELLADGSVTFAEYQQATMAAVTCIERAEIAGGAVDVDGPRPRQLDSGRIDDRFLHYEVAVSADEPPAGTSVEQWGMAVGEDVDRIATRCHDEYLRDVDRVWTFQHLLPPAERERQRGLLVTCLRATGAAVADSATTDDILVVVTEHLDDPDVVACRDSYPDYFLLGVH